jgi:hypothetical protein
MTARLRIRAVELKRSNEPQPVYWARLSIRAILHFTCVATVLGQSPAKPAEERTTPESSALAQPSIRIPVEPFGYHVPGTAHPNESSPTDGVYFIDPDHLLFTFKAPVLLDRMTDCLPSDSDRVIRAVVVSLSTGKAENNADWRLHDRGPFFWPLSGGRFLIRVRDRLLLTNRDLTLQPFLKVSHLNSVQVSPDGKLLILQIETERHTPKKHKQLTELARWSQAAPPQEDVRIVVINVETRKVIAESREKGPIYLPLIREGFVETVPHMGHWTLRYVAFGGKPRTVTEFASKCDPQTAVLNKDAVLLVTCPTTNGGRGANVIGMDGKPLWSIRADRDFAQERLSASSDGSRVALSRLRLVSHANNSFPLINDENVAGQQITVFDTDTGKLRVVGSASPANGFGQNYSLAPDGSRFATLDNHEIEVYDLPPTTLSSALSAREPLSDKLSETNKF